MTTDEKPLERLRRARATLDKLRETQPTAYALLLSRLQEHLPTPTRAHQAPTDDDRSCTSTRNP